MCGRLNLSDLDGIRSLMAQIGMPLFSDDETVRYNVSPGTTIPVLHTEGGQNSRTYTWSDMHWGMPVNTRPGAPLSINARSETVHEKPLFKQLTSAQRAIVPASGFYEWLKQGREKRPFHFSSTVAPALLMAGLWRKRQGDREEVVILTTAANADVADIHDRMPVMLGANQAHGWLTGEQNVASVIALQAPGTLSRRAVARHVNSPRHDGPDCLDDSQAEPYTGDLFN